MKPSSCGFGSEEAENDSERKDYMAPKFLRTGRATTSPDVYALK